MAAVTICSDFGAPQNKVSHCFPMYFPWSDGTRCHDLSFLNVVPCPVLTVDSSPAYRFLRTQVRWSGISISWRIFHNLLWSTKSRMSDSRWVITPLWFSGSWRSFLYSYSMYSCHLFLISSASVRSIWFVSFIVPVFAWNIPLVYLIFLKRSVVFPILLFSSISLHWSLQKAFLSLRAILWNSA